MRIETLPEDYCAIGVGSGGGGTGSTLRVPPTYAFLTYACAHAHEKIKLCPPGTDAFPTPMYNIMSACLHT